MTSEVFDKLYCEYKQKFIQIAISYVQDKSIAEDIITDSFVYFWENKNNLPADTNVKAYVLGVVKKKCLMHLREQKIHRKIQDTIYQCAQWEIQQNIAVLEDCELTKQLFSHEVEAIFRAQVEALPKITRMIYKSNRFENLTYQQIAEKYNLSQRQVLREMQRALSSLRLALKDYFPVAVVALLLFRKIG